MAISTVTGFAVVAGVAAPSRYSTASPRSGDGLLSFSRMTIRPATPAAATAPIPTASIPASDRIASLSETVASEGVELSVLLPNTPGARSDAGPAIPLYHHAATCFAASTQTHG